MASVSGKTCYLAFDLGASSGRAVVGTLENDTMRTEEVHRFTTPVVEDGDRLYWDIAELWHALLTGLDKALRATGGLRSLSVDSWAVDYVPLDHSGNPLRNPHCYRDPRVDGMMDRVDEILPRDKIYGVTGIQFMEINTLYQVFADCLFEPELVDRTAKRLMIADFFNYRFSGRPVIELSNASSTQLVDVRKRQWSSELMHLLGMDPAQWGEIVPSGTRLNATAESRNVPVVAGLSHDTACAVAAVPASGQRWAFLSSGTWSLIGVERSDPILSHEAFEQSYTNEIGLGGSIRFLKNLTGLWVLQECVREWEEGGERISYATLAEEARDAGPVGGTLDLDAPEFAHRGNMEVKLRAYLAERQEPAPRTRGALVRCILESMARSYADRLGTLSSLVGHPIERVHIVGGGSKNDLLCQLTAQACGVEVVAGPAEATALGNVLVQAQTMGDLPEGLSIRDIARNSSDIRVYSATS